ncbi:hypothetical protein G9A89_018019 [Geosiphon pyriformis]|nr:hypothetical protein G9A89_018019 [Geosiphon pyriformis]
MPYLTGTLKNCSSVKTATTHECQPLVTGEKKNKEKEKKKEKDILEETNDNTETSDWKILYSTDTRPEPPHIPLRCKDYKKKLSSMEAWIMPDEDY